MPKMKTNSGSKKRFTLTGTGKINGDRYAYRTHDICTQIANAVTSAYS